METAGAEALSVFPSENPSRHIRISTAKKVGWNFILGNARGLPSISLPTAWVHGIGLRLYSPGLPPCGKFQIAFLKQVGPGREKAFPEEAEWDLLVLCVLCQLGGAGPDRHPGRKQGM